MMSALDKRIATLETLVARDIGTVRGFEKGLVPPEEGWFALVCAFWIRSQPVSTPSRLQGIDEGRIQDAVIASSSLTKIHRAFKALRNSGYAYGDRGELDGFWEVKKGQRSLRKPNATEGRKCTRARDRVNVLLVSLSDDAASALKLDRDLLSVWERAFLVWQICVVLFLSDGKGRIRG